MKKLLFFNKTFFRCLAHDYFFLIQKYFTKNKLLELATADAEGITEVTIDLNERL